MKDKFVRYQRSLPYSYAFGVYPTIELLRSRPRAAVSVVVSERSSRNAGLDQIRSICERIHVPVRTDDPQLRRLCANESHLAVAVFEKQDGVLGQAEAHVVLVNPTSRGNVGTIVRSMVGFGFSGLALIRPAVDIYHPQTVRASMGSLFRISFQYFNSMDQYYAAFPRTMYGLDPHGTVPVDELKPRFPFAIVFGGEGAGLPRNVRCDTLAYIPQSSEIDSLNLSSAAAIALFEIGRAVTCRRRQTERP